MKKTNTKTNKLLKQSEVKATMKVKEVNNNKTRKEMEHIRGINDELKYEDSPWL